MCSTVLMFVHNFFFYSSWNKANFSIKLNNPKTLGNTNKILIKKIFFFGLFVCLLWHELFKDAGPTIQDIYDAHEFWLPFVTLYNNVNEAKRSDCDGKAATMTVDCLSYISAYSSPRRNLISRKLNENITCATSIYRCFTLVIVSKKPVSYLSVSKPFWS